jgi:protein phosphatase
VDEQHVGAAVQCGKCTRPFSVKGAAAQPSAAPPSPAAPSQAGGFWAGLREGLSRFLPMTVRPEPEKKPAEEEEVLPDLDGPGAAALLDPDASGPAPPAAAGCRLDVGSATSPGRVRLRNEDSFLVHHLAWSNLDRRREIALAVVADGLGGHEAGDLASGLVIRIVGGALAPLLGNALSGQSQDDSPARLAETIKNAIKGANHTVYRKGQAEAGCKGMGATAAVVLVWDGQVHIGHVGDCRVYRFHDGELTQVTRDQTLVARMVELGQLTPQEAQTHPARNEVIQAIGNYSDIDPASYQLKLLPGDWLVVACDGLHAHVGSRTLAEAIKGAGASASALAGQLVELANKGGGTDNCTVVAVRCY